MNGGSIIFKPLQTSFSVVSVCCIRNHPQMQCLTAAPIHYLWVSSEALLFWACRPGPGWPGCRHPHIWALRVGSSDGWTGPVFTWLLTPEGQPWLISLCLRVLCSKRGNPSTQVPPPKAMHTRAQTRELERWEPSSCWKELLGNSAEGQTNRQGLWPFLLQSTPGDHEGQGSLVCCTPWGRKDSDTT